MAGARTDLRMPRSAAVSLGLHALLLLALLIGLPATTPENSGEQSVSMVFEGSGPAASVMKADTPGPTPSPLNSPKTVEAPPADRAPQPKPLEETLPQSVAPTPVPLPQPQKITQTAQPTPPRETSEMPAPVRPPTQSKPVQQTDVKPLPTPPIEPPKERPVQADTKPSHITQPRVAANTVPESRTLLATLERLRSEPQTHAPQHPYNAPQGSAPGGGRPTGTANALLSRDDAGAIGADVRRCWTYDSGARDVEKMQVRMIVLTDASGVARDASVAPTDQARLGDPVFRAFAERAVRAVMDVRCASLPLPNTLKGQPQTLTFLFRPGE